MFISRSSKDRKYSNSGGFTILEVIILVVIGGIVLASLGSFILTYIEKNKLEKTEYRIEKIRQSIYQYLSKYNHYPCPSRLDLVPEGTDSDDSDFGLPKDCSDNSVAGRPEVYITPAPPINFGAVPTRILNLPDEYAMDGWGNKFTYSVTRTQAVPLQYVAGNGNIRIDAPSAGMAGTTTLTTTADYVIISHGKTATGAYPLRARIQTIPCDETSANERENCDADSRYTAMMVQVSRDTNDIFDDLVYFQVDNAMALIPAGAVMPLANTTDTCPDGWIPFRTGEGGMLVGDNPTVAAYSISRGSIEFCSTSNSGLNVGHGYETPGSPPPFNNNLRMPPHFARLMCEKLPE